MNHSIKTNLTLEETLINYLKKKVCRGDKTPITWNDEYRALLCGLLANGYYQPLCNLLVDYQTACGTPENFRRVK